MDEENSSLWPWVLGLMAFKVYKNKKIILIKTFLILTLKLKILIITGKKNNYSLKINLITHHI